MSEAASPTPADSFPYRARVAEVMSAPAVTVEADLPLAEAAALMRGRGISSLMVTDDAGRPRGVLTERDLLTAIVDLGGTALHEPVSARMCAPVHGVTADSYVHVAIARMDRLRIRHLAVTDAPGGRLVGVVSARALLRHRAGSALMLGDEVAEAGDGAALAAAQARLPDLARALRDEGVDALEIARLVSAVLRDISARAAAIAEAAMVDAGHGPAPAPWCYLVLGSGGRGESLLSADQDNAIVHRATAADDPWYAELGRRASDLLDQAGIPYCKGKVMASNAAWRGSLDEWGERIAGWVERPTAENLLSVDIFYDFRPVHGDFALADELRGRAVAAARRSRMFLALLAEQLRDRGAPLGFFGRIVTEEGRVDLKRGGTLPIVAGARVLALRSGSAELATGARLAAAVADGTLNENDAGALQDAFATLMDLVLEQQLLDLAAGRPAGSRVEVRRLTARRRGGLKTALRAVSTVDYAVHGALSKAG
jgi:signal-transduction protein with cAMP-binding, CBS, and nucleotidyltransferase domain